MTQSDVGMRAVSLGTPEVDGEAASSESAFLLNYLKTHDAVCPLCKYNLRALTVPRCPECGREIKLTIGLTEPYLRFFIVTVIALSLALGAGLTCLLMCLAKGFPRAHEGVAVLFLVGGSMVSILPVLAGLTFARRMLRLPTVAQLAVVSVVVLWDLLLVLVFMGLIFNWFW